MLDRIAEYCTLKLIGKNVIEEKKKAIFIYGFQLFFSTISSIITMLLIAVITNNLLNGIIYLFVFMSLRITANGYHANTCGRCYLLTCVVFILYLCCLNFPFIVRILSKIEMVLLLFSVIYIWCNAPVEHPNHRLSEVQKRNNRLAARCIIIGVILAVIFMDQCSLNNIAYAINIAVYIVVLMMLVKN